MPNRNLFSGFTIPGGGGGFGPTTPVPGTLPPGTLPGGGGTGSKIGGFLGGLFGRSGLGSAVGGLFDDPQQKGCPPGYEKKGGNCVETGVMGTVRRALPGGRSGTLEDVYGDATMGRYGVALVPAERTTSVLDCPEGMVLGKDNLCYERLRKSERKWPPGRKPLLTGGEMNAITTASRAAGKLLRTKKRLKKVQRALKKVT